MKIQRMSPQPVERPIHSHNHATASSTSIATTSYSPLLISSLVSLRLQNLI